MACSPDALARCGPGQFRDVLVGVSALRRLGSWGVRPYVLVGVAKLWNQQIATAPEGSIVQWTRSESVYPQVGLGLEIPLSTRLALAPEVRLDALFLGGFSGQMSRSSIASTRPWLWECGVDARRTRTSLRRAGLVSFVLSLLLAPSQGWAQALPAFEDLALLVNLDDQLQVEDQSGAKTTGRLTRLTRNDMTIQTNAGEKRFRSDTVRGVAVRGHALRRSAFVGAGVFAVLGAVATCSHRGGGDCGIVGLRAAPVGVGVGLAIGALIPQMKSVYHVPEHPVSVSPARAASGSQASLLEDLALWVNLDDRLRIEDQSGVRTTGRLTHLTADEMTIHTDAGEMHFTRETVRQIAVRRRPLHTGVLIGAGVGAVLGALAACTGADRSECADGPILLGRFGGGIGLAVSALIPRTTTVYPMPAKRTFVLPAI